MAKSQTAQFEYIARLKFASILRYMTDHTPEEVLEPDYFNNSGQYLEAGDSVDVVCQQTDGGWQKMQLEVTSKVGKVITVVMRLAFGVDVSDGIEPVEVAGPEARELTAEYVPSNRKWIVRAGDETVARNLNKAEAEAMAAGTAPLPDGDIGPADPPAEKEAA